MKKRDGFTILELLVVISIIGLIAGVVIIAINDSRTKGQDSGKKVQLQEVLKALELYYSDTGIYPDDGTPADNATGDVLTDIGSGFVGGAYLKRLPNDSDVYQYCVSSDRKSLIFAVNTEDDKGGSNYCSVTRGIGPNYGCDAWYTANAMSPCSTRF
jgi:prepilin-type N-terminal cleavage/methylation domain-containing protein